MKLSKIIWGDMDPYANVAFEPELELQGFDLKCPTLEMIVDWYQPKRVLEIGVHRGGSIIWMAMCAPGAEFVGVDPWVCILNNWRKDYRRARYADAYDYFKRCVVSRMLQDKITYLPMRSETAYDLFDEKEITFDLVYIDGGHNYPNCLYDIVRARKICAGPIIVDDFEPGRFDDIVRACNEFGEPFDIEGRKAVFYGNAGRPSKSDG